MGILITGTGRSGTKFLSENLKLSEKYKVYHELKGDDRIYDKSLLNPIDKNLLSIVNKRFKSDNYIEVNGYLRKIAIYMELDRLRTIIRSPHELLKSGYNRWTIINKKTDNIVNLLNEDLITIDKINEKTKDTPIVFNKMVNDREYLYSIIKWCGIDDIDINDLILNKINKTHNYRYTPPKQMVTNMEDKCGWFIEKYSEYI